MRFVGFDTVQHHYYFAYGSNLLDREIARTITTVECCGKAYLPRYDLVFSKHSATRGGDAASIREDESKIVWGVLYRVNDADRDRLRTREGGYRETDVNVSVVEGDDVTPQRAFTFIGEAVCPRGCGPTTEYLQLVVEGAKQRGLPDGYWRDILARYASN
jgi:cation transport regulator ChaC